MRCLSDVRCCLLVGLTIWMFSADIVEISGWPWFSIERFVWAAKWWRGTLADNFTTKHRHFRKPIANDLSRACECFEIYKWCVPLVILKSDCGEIGLTLTRNSKVGKFSKDYYSNNTLDYFEFKLTIVGIWLLNDWQWLKNTHNFKPFLCDARRKKKPDAGIIFVWQPHHPS
jgi:hypothetical protein